MACTPAAGVLFAGIDLDGSSSFAKPEIDTRTMYGDAVPFGYQ